MDIYAKKCVSLSPKSKTNMEKKNENDLKLEAFPEDITEDGTRRKIGGDRGDRSLIFKKNQRPVPPIVRNLW